MIPWTILISGMLLSHTAGGAIWTFPAVLASAFIIAWGAETAQFIVSQGMALAILAWLQTLPEFAVEATISWGAATGATSDQGVRYTTHLITQNFTGSIRLLIGVGMPLVFFVRYLFAKDRTPYIRLYPEQSVEIGAVVPIMAYFVLIYFKGTLELFDSAALLAMYVAYLLILQKLPPEEMEASSDLPFVSRKLLALPRRRRNFGVAALFVIGGIILFYCAEPFVNSVIDLAPAIGISSAMAIQYIAPFMSEFPEKVSVFNWSRQGGKKATMGVMNIFSSNINQWTVLVGMIPIMYCLGRGAIVPIVLDYEQRQEIAVTLLQSVLCFFMLADLQFSRWDAIGLFSLFAVQFLKPDWRPFVAAVYGLWIVVEMAQHLFGKKDHAVIKEFRTIWQTYIRKKKADRSPRTR